MIVHTYCRSEVLVLVFIVGVLGTVVGRWTSPTQDQILYHQARSWFACPPEKPNEKLPPYYAWVSFQTMESPIIALPGDLRWNVTEKVCYERTRDGWRRFFWSGGKDRFKDGKDKYAEAIKKRLQQLEKERKK